MKHYLVLCLLGLLISCSEEGETVADVEATKKEEVKTVVNPNLPAVDSTMANKMYKDYYPGTKQIKFEGFYDADVKRHGIWKMYSPEGNLSSMTEYIHGIREGVSIVYFPSGQVNYRGSYKNDKPVGVWKTYDPQTGKVASEKDYGN